ncbi:MAG: VOC family protein [Clostridia bacterium]|nr:VOC family protein [Clostridia bacterium]
MKTIHHVAIICSDREKALAFYHEKLGLPILREHYREKRDDWKIDLEMDGCELELFIMKNCPKRPSYPEAYGLRHLAFRVPDVETAVRELEAKGIPCEPVRVDDYTGKKMTFFFDPDGLPLEIHE